jgi:hypothetical protein
LLEAVGTYPGGHAIYSDDFVLVEEEVEEESVNVALVGFDGNKMFSFN